MYPTATAAWRAVPANLPHLQARVLLFTLLMSGRIHQIFYGVQQARDEHETLEGWGAAN